MAQQVTNNSLILDSLATTQNSYVDSSVAKFDSVLDVANKTFSKQNDLLNTINSNNTVSNTSSATVNVTDNTSANTSVSTTDNSNSTNMTSRVTSDTDTKSTSNNTSDTTNQVSNESKVADNADKNDTKADTENNQTDDTTDSAQEDVTVSVADIVSKYTYLDNMADNITDNTEITDDTLADTTVSDIENETVNNIVDNVSENTPSIDTTQVTEDLTAIATPVVDTQVSDIADTNTVSLDDTDTVTVKVADNLLSNDDVSLTNEKNIGKDLISQKMVEDLNITIEDVSNSTQAEEVLDDSTLMDSTEQAVKYMMDKETATGSDITVESNVEIKNADTKNVVLKDTSLQIEEVSADMTVADSSEVTEDLVVDTEGEKDVNLANDSVSSDNTSDTQDSEQVVEVDNNTDSLMEENNSSSDENAHGETQDDNVKAEDKSELKKNFFTSSVSEDVEPVDTQADSNNMQTVETVSVHKVHSQQSTMTVGTQTTTSASNQVNISKEDVLAQIHSKLQMMNSTSNTKLTMVLNPESLGKVSIQLMNTKDGLTAELQVASQAVKDILDSNLSNLKDTLSAQGVQVNDMSVKVSQSENNADMDYTEQEGNGGNKQEQEKRHQEQEKEKEFEKMFSKFQNDEEQEIEG